MYPRTYVETFMRYEAKDQAFVAMPFSEPFRQVFEQIIEPAIRRVTVNSRPLQAHIINRGTSGSPDIHEQIFDAILHSRLVIADMTVQSMYTLDDGSTRWQPNANVTYEVGLAAAWRNPEDILLIHQGHASHTYSFDVQNLRHVQYDPSSSDSIDLVAGEIVRALNQSSFLAKRAYQKLVESVSPSAVQFMYQEVARSFPVVSFSSPDLGVMDARVHAASELLRNGALRNRNVIPQGTGMGVAIIYEWTELGLRMLETLRAASAARREEMSRQIASVPDGVVPPLTLLSLPSPQAPAIDMVAAAEIDDKPEAVKGD